MKKRYLHTLILAALFALVSSAAAVGAEKVFAQSDVRFKVEFNSREYSFTYTDKDLQPTDHLVADEIYARKINAPLTEKRAIMARALKSGATYERAVTICMPLIKNLVDEAEKKLYVAPVNAQMTFNPNASPPFTVKRDRAGRMLDREKTFALIYAAVQRYKGECACLALPVLRADAETEAQQLIKQTYTKADFYTEFNTENGDRAHNVALSLQKLNGIIVDSGAQFSFNETVGQRTAQNGFKEAKIIMDGEYVLGYGGGVCQTSTTLYNAALIAGMQIDMVRNHSLTSSYVSPSLDAMVNSGSSDLRFTNPYDTPVYIKAWTQGGRACIRIYGEENEYKIVPRSYVLQVSKAPDDRTIVDSEYKYLPKEAASGESKRLSYGKDGVKSEAYLEYYKEGVLVKRVKIRTDVYKSAQGVIAVAP